ncbi:hypothetical protein W97_03946 [Coniosporium apollinis CBS 100218]|uniref:Peptide hydrolase n=1 Tax=Coniosporium apollinis (strain CBS 100218) TaxID=1168221 RepID=R7YS99_CONA1|nr:uncharacterized protein W97_03946 [Coniosporium apollinis CBS 100218]EON64713.1 hypothetical protein W97_03946 [Coniosporium apollinis CBS 100218]
MKFSVFLAAAVASSASALSIGKRDGPETFTIELAPGDVRTVTEAEKWDLRREGKNFMDITDYPDLAAHALKERAAVVFPSRVSQQAAVTPLLPALSKANMQSNLVTFSNYFNRYYRSTYGVQSSQWLQGRVQAVITASGADKYGAKVTAFQHSWGQSSIIATIPGKSAKTIVIGSHQDSVNLNNPSAGRAPGADDDGSGCVTILEAMRVLLTNPTIRQAQGANTIEFHWYAAEEGGLLGSGAIFQSYAAAGRDVKAMLQQDMTGYVQGTLAAGKPESVGVITDFVDVGLSEFIKKVITAYCRIPYVSTKCGYACSDHASASKAGYPSAFVIEAAMEHTSKLIHTTQDTVSTVSYDHMLEHAKMTLGFAVELAFATL